ncbi:LacI family DNA-binding transcriptional regulator [Corynebacterium sp. AOP40-9SA-29]|uniref:LacI family DNA-binding transcriptional regulator n=1 Tax=Corynebacterium sp. AOP40-9SA-29 TaxID=3457677 RepID=UPI004034EB8F
MATRKDVAERAGVSPSTVSYVLSGKRTISGATRARVEQAIRELEYTPNAAARALAGAHSGLIALHFPVGSTGPNTTEFEYLTSISQQAQARGYHMLLLSTPSEDLDSLVGLISSQAVDGVLLMEIRLEDPRIPALRGTDLPFALLGRPEDTDGLVCVDDDFELLGDKAVEHLVSQGHHHIAYISQEASYLEAGHGPARRTLAALEKSATNRGAELLHLTAESSINGGESVLDQVLGHFPRPTAVIGFNELAITGLVRAAPSRGVTIPHDLSVVGLSFPSTIAEILSPPLTTVAPSPRDLAAASVDALAEVIGGRAASSNELLLEPTLTVRRSSATPQGR